VGDKPGRLLYVISTIMYRSSRAIDRNVVAVAAKVASALAPPTMLIASRSNASVLDAAAALALPLRGIEVCTALPDADPLATAAPAMPAQDRCRVPRRCRRR
jgi:hypothetical protein